MPEVPVKGDSLRGQLGLSRSICSCSRSMVAEGSFCRSDSHLSLERDPFYGLGRQPICCCLCFLHSWELGLLSEGEEAFLMLFLAGLKSSEYACLRRSCW